MSESRPLRLLNRPDDVMRAERAARGARIDKLSVDRSRLAGVPLQRRSPEMEAGEAKWEEYRSELTITDRWQAWRAFFKKLT